MNRGRLSQATRRLRACFSFPLLATELTETAARRRTYVLRSIYAVALYASFALLLPAEFWNGSNQWYGSLGIGGRMFQALLVLQFFGVALFLPALMCGRITQEKERDSLILLFLTELGPWSIILQKYAGGLVLMLSCFLLGLPLAGVAYAFGGLDNSEILVELAALVLTSFQVGAIALLCSAWYRSTVGAFLATYLWAALFYAGPPLLALLLREVMPEVINYNDFEEYFLALIPPAALSRTRFTSSPDWTLALAPSLISIVIFLGLARRFLVRRALVPPSNFLRLIFTRIDALMKHLNRATGGIVFWHGSSDLPVDEPVFWRETHRRVLGKPNYLIRVLYAVEIPTVFVCVMVSYTGPSYYGSQSFPQYEGLSFLLGILATMAALVVSAHAANSVVSERVGQTLEVLLTTPLSAREIIRQKERALWRLLLVIAVPLLTVCVCETSLEDGFAGSRAGKWLPYLTCAFLLVVIYLPLITWLSLWISLRVRTRFQAIICAVGAFTVWAGLAPVLFFLVNRFTARGDYPNIWNGLVLLSPASVGILNEIGPLHSYLWFFGGPWPVILVNSAFYGMLALLIRWRLFADAEKFLRN